jgi:hypothetical protein
MRMDLAGYVINAVLVEGRSVKDVCEAHDISRSWLYELIARYLPFHQNSASSSATSPAIDVAPSPPGMGVGKASAAQ